MAIRSALPEFSKLQPNGEPWPDYVYQPFPRYVGLDAEGNALIADTEEEARRLKEIAVFPQNMGSDKDGKPVIAQGPRDLIFFKDRVVTPPEDPAVVAKRQHVVEQRQGTGDLVGGRWVAYAGHAGPEKSKAA